MSCIYSKGQTNSVIIFHLLPIPVNPFISYIAFSTNSVLIEIKGNTCIDFSECRSDSRYQHLKADDTPHQEKDHNLNSLLFWSFLLEIVGLINVELKAVCIYLHFILFQNYKQADF